jgi:hypothetical protein
VDQVGGGNEFISLIEVAFGGKLSGGEVPDSVVDGASAGGDGGGDLVSGAFEAPTVMYPRSAASRAEKGPKPLEKVSAIDASITSEISSMVMLSAAACSIASSR